VKGRIAVVPPRYGTSFVGGAETVTREAAEGLAARGWEVDALTTCASDHIGWANDLPAGESVENGVRVLRFPTVRPASRYERDHIEHRIQVGLQPSPSEELAWLNGLFRVPELYHHLLAHSSEYRAIIFAPYLFWTTVVGAAVAPERSIVMPCLHDESYARLGMYRDVLPRCAQGWFLSEPERQLAQALGLAPARSYLTGAGMHIPTTYDPEAMRARLGTDRPVVAYVGRRERGKGWDDLLVAFEEAVLDHGAEIDLVTCGSGEISVPGPLSGRVHDLGFVTDQERSDLLAAATACFHPSRMESFSRTVMEAWLAGTAVVVPHDGEVLRWHVERSGGGFTWHDRHELVAALELCAERPDVPARLAPAGREYVLDSYTWPVVLDRMEAALEEMPAGTGAP
jgi:glycosyltransferase involved in cell wall biosynthesis